jgi:very-short-patch-repair endonuclease
LHRGVYAVGHRRLSNEGRWFAAILACGDGAALSHRSAAALWGFGVVAAGPVDITVAGTGGRKKRRGINLHRSPSLAPAAVTVRSGIPVTLPARTLADLRRVMRPAELRQALRKAEVLGLDTGEREPDLTRSELEHLFLRLCRRHRLPPPEVNVPVDAFVVDFLWRDRRLIVEVDGYRYHRGRSVFEGDHARDIRLKVLGYEVLRFTWRQLSQEPGAVAATLRAMTSR